MALILHQNVGRFEKSFVAQERHTKKGRLTFSSAAPIQLPYTDKSPHSVK
jgi:hypothetical protein